MGFRRAAGRLTGLLSGASQLKHPFTAPTLKPTSNRRPLRGYPPPSPPRRHVPAGHPTTLWCGRIGLKQERISSLPISITSLFKHGRLRTSTQHYQHSLSTHRSSLPISITSLFEHGRLPALSTPSTPDQPVPTPLPPDIFSNPSTTSTQHYQHS